MSQSWIRRLFSRSKVSDAGLEAPPAAGPSPLDRAIRLRAAANDSIQNFQAGLGATAYDKSAFNDYSVVTGISELRANSMYRGDWLCARIVNSVADDMTRAWLECTWDGKDDQEEYTDQIEAAEQALGVQAKVNEAIKWARLYGGGAIILGIKGQKLSEPLDLETVRKGSLSLLHVMDRWRLAATGMNDEDTESPNFGNPLHYTLYQSAEEVHWSRVIRFDGRVLPWYEWQRNGRWHDSELQALMTNVQDYAATRAATASLVFESNVDIIKTPDLAANHASDDGTAIVTDRYQSMVIMKSINRALILDKDEEYQQKQVSFAGINEVLEKFMVDVCGACDIPMTRLFGRSPGGLNATGDSDLRNYYDHISARQNSAVRPQLMRLYEVLVRSTIGSMPPDFGIRFNPLWQVSDLDRAQIDKLRMETDAGYINAGVLTEGMVAKELKDRGTYRTLEDEDVKMVEQLAEEAKENAVEIDKARFAAIAQVRPKPGAGKGT